MAGYNMDLEPIGQTSGIISNSDMDQPQNWLLINNYKITLNKENDLVLIMNVN